MFIAAQLIIVKMQGKPKCPSSDEWVNKNVVSLYNSMKYFDNKKE